MNQTLKITRKEAAPFLQAAGIEYNGRKFKVEFTEKVTFYDTNWDGGTHNAYYLLDMMTSQGKKVVAPAPWDNPFEGQSFYIPLGRVVVERSYFCGHDMGVRIYANPAQAPQWLEGAK